MYCTCCGKKIMDGCNFCPECGAQLNMNAKRGADMVPLGTLMNVMLITGAMQALYYYNGQFYNDKFCTSLFPIGMVSMQYRNPMMMLPGFLGFGMIHMGGKGGHGFGGNGFGGGFILRK